jgi:hypothetical protein
MYRVNDLELASRLSFFLWSSIPDDELLNLAAQGKLKARPVLDQQIKRMLKDSKSQALTQNFAGQWLYLRNLKNQIPNSSSSRTLTTTSDRRSRRRPNSSSTAFSKKIATS